MGCNEGLGIMLTIFCLTLIFILHGLSSLFRHRLQTKGELELRLVP